MCKELIRRLYVFDTFRITEVGIEKKEISDYYGNKMVRKM